jgi:predicted porin
VTTAVDSPLGRVLPTQQVTNIANDVDTDAWYAMLGYDVNSALNVSVRYAAIDQGNAAGNADLDEWVVQGDYKYNKKLSLRAYYSIKDYDDDTKGNDNNQFQFQALYKF